MKLLTNEELRSSRGIGASEVAAVLHLSPFTTAFQLWQEKTGRVPKPPQTPAMFYGIEKEPEAFTLYKHVSGRDEMQAQIAASHQSLSFLRCVADGWDGHHGVEIKCPTSPKLFKSVVEGIVPTYYLLQLAATMQCFGVATWDLFIYHSPESYVLKAVTMGDPFPGFSSLNHYWCDIAVPALVDFAGRIDEDRWLNPNFTASINESAWTQLVNRRNVAREAIERAEVEKDDAEAQLKQMLGRATRVTCAGWRASWTRWKPTYELSIEVISEQKLKELSDALEVIQGADGIRKVKVKSKPENYVFKLQLETE